MTQRTLIVGWNKLLESLSAGLLSANDLNRALFWQLDPHKMDGLCAQAYNWISCRPALERILIELLETADEEGRVASDRVDGNSTPNLEAMLTWNGAAAASAETIAAFHTLSDELKAQFAMDHRFTVL
jgi:hypothetical protein